MEANLYWIHILHRKNLLSPRKEYTIMLVNAGTSLQWKIRGT